MSSSGEIEIGNIYKIAANEENGITPPDGRDVWFKHFVVMGKAPDGSVYGCVVFDSEMNRDETGTRPGGSLAVWKGEEDILLRLIGKEVTLREGRKRVDMEDFVIPFNLFSLRDAIAFSETGVELTMRIMQFQNREQSVGTPIDILTLTPDGAKWKQIN